MKCERRKSNIKKGREMHDRIKEEKLLRRREENDGKIGREMIGRLEEKWSENWKMNDKKIGKEMTWRVEDKC